MLKGWSIHVIVGCSSRLMMFISTGPLIYNNLFTEFWLRHLKGSPLYMLYLLLLVLEVQLFMKMPYSVVSSETIFLSVDITCVMYSLLLRKVYFVWILAEMCVLIIPFFFSGSCMGCVNQRVVLVHPSRDMFVAGQESFGGFCTDNDTDSDNNDDYYY